MKFRLAAPKYLVDIGRLGDLKYIREDGENIEIGALTTHYQIESSELLKAKCPLLPETAAEIGDVQVRNRGTIGGSISHADPAGDWPAPILALDADIKAVSTRGERWIAARDLFVELLTTALEGDEILTAIRVPTLGARTGSAYLKLHHPASGYAMVGVAARFPRRARTHRQGKRGYHGRGSQSVSRQGGGRRSAGEAGEPQAAGRSLRPCRRRHRG